MTNSSASARPETASPASCPGWCAGGHDGETADFQHDGPATEVATQDGQAIVAHVSQFVDDDGRAQPPRVTLTVGGVGPFTLDPGAASRLAAGIRRSAVSAVSP